MGAEGNRRRALQSDEVTCGCGGGASILSAGGVFIAFGVRKLTNSGADLTDFGNG
ncbi:hypothetical protein J2851_005428 [Azospirillum rugosum]|uniref:Uncharacterized protein n=1 Tax=Azospirillum rugosum TaxID=416170 RepID=A0ABS4ST56_9PROT|nr:hypothetical protein [Azospirillum rugosum]MDQ0529493.1 hypothetical protein [Azospirillum rugosum]